MTEKRQTERKNVRKEKERKTEKRETESPKKGNQDEKKTRKKRKTKIINPSKMQGAQENLLTQEKSLEKVQFDFFGAAKYIPFLKNCTAENE